MLNASTVFLVGLLWLLILFAVAVFGERRARIFERHWAVIYALSMAVYCTAWTFFGTVTQAARGNTPIPPTFIGTIVMMIFGVPILARFAALVRAQNSASIADLIATRFGKSAILAASITLVVVVGMVPYVALQLKAVAMSFAMLTGGAERAPAWQDAALWVAIMMAAFAMLFGTRRASAIEHNRGLILAIAFESILKLIAMLAIGAYAVFGLHDGFGDLMQQSQGTLVPTINSSFVTLTILGAVAMFTLPHQFHVGLVEQRQVRDLQTARWLFPLYLILIAIPTLPLAWAGQVQLQSWVPPDLYVLGLPMSKGQDALALFTFLGGVSAAIGMVIVVALTLSIMIANHWIAPRLVRAARLPEHGMRDRVLWHRRFAIVLVIGLAWAYSRALDRSEALADIGALSFSALALLAPAMLAALYRPQWSPRAITVSLWIGGLVWVWIVFGNAWLSAEVARHLQHGNFHWLLPEQFFGMQGVDRMSRATWCSLIVLCVVLIAMSRMGRVIDVNRVQEIESSVLRALVARFLPEDLTRRLFDEAEFYLNQERVAKIEHELSPVIGAASAKILVDAARRSPSTALDSVADIVGQASQTLQFNQQILQAALENMSQGISVVDQHLGLVAWNQRYVDLFQFPASMLRVGVPVAELLRHNLAREIASAKILEEETEKRLAHMRARTPYVTERQFPDGAIIEIRGNPMPRGGFVATFTDVTEFRATEAKLKLAAETLEQRVTDRTADLAKASQVAERANQAKSRFLAAVSHDLLQPIHAAHLFNHALNQALQHEDYRDHVRHIDGALNSAESLLAGLLDISRLDAGGMRPQVRAFALRDIFDNLSSEFGVLAAERGLQLHCVSTALWVESDPALLRRVLQNFLANAVRYTQSGRVLLGCRRRGERVELQVWDSGPGIAASEREVIFEEFRRLDHGGQGLGLGLAIADRMAQLLQHPLILKSVEGKGSMFAVQVPITKAQFNITPTTIEAVEPTPTASVLVMDNDLTVLNAMQTLLRGWGCEVFAASEFDQALQLARQCRPDLLLLDFHLNGPRRGTDLQQAIVTELGDIPTIVITADHAQVVRDAVNNAHAHLLHKPVKPLALKSLMNRLLIKRSRS